MKYRRKGEIVDASYNATGFATPQMIFKGPCYHYERPDGQEVVYSAERFEREFERAEEETKIAVCPYDIGRKCENTHCEICTYCMTRESANCETSDGVTRFFCHGCWAKRCAEKSKRLTIADLKPGDVFGWCQPRSPNKKQMLTGTTYFSVNWGRVVSLGDFPRDEVAPLLRYCHHDLTEKQRLWANATHEEREAMESSIRDKWLPRTRGEPKSLGVCAVCTLHTDKQAVRQCGDCIISKAGERCDSPDSPWKNWRDQTRGQATLEKDWEPLCPQDYKMSRNMTISLSDFLPNIHPLRIEVEATPVEWPGKARDK